MTTRRALRFFFFSFVPVAAMASLGGCAVDAQEDSASSADAVSSVPAQCPQFARGHVAKGAWGGDVRGCVIERCADGWANAEPNDGVGNPLMKGTYESGILGMIDDGHDGCETNLEKLLAARSAPASAVENLGEVAGDDPFGGELHGRGVGDHVYRVHVKETSAGLPKPERLLVTVTHYETMPYRIEVWASRGGGPKTACTGAVESFVWDDPEHDKTYKSRPDNTALDFTAAKAVAELASIETPDTPIRDDSYDLFVKVSLDHPERASAVGEPGFLIHVEPALDGVDPMKMRCAP